MQKQKRVSLKDIAEELNVSVASVSRALNDSPQIGKELKKKVLELAQDKNYRPNPFAQRLRKGGPMVIGVVTPSMNSHYHSSVIAGIEDLARKSGYSIICANSHENPAYERQIIENFIEMHVDGIICCISQDTTDYCKFEELLQMNVPTVFYARTILPEKFSSVVSNDQIASRQAGEHLIKQGCKRIGFIGGPAHLDMVKRRKKGLIEALHEAHMEVKPELFKNGQLNRETAYASAVSLIRDQHVDAILGINYDCVYGAIDALRQNKLRIPQDVALIGFVDDPDVRYLTPSISSIVDSSKKIGEECCSLILKQIAGDTVVRHVVLPMDIFIRESSKR